MKRTIMVSVMVIVMLMATIASASAWYIQLENDSGDGLNFEVVWYQGTDPGSAMTRGGQIIMTEVPDATCSIVHNPAFMMGMNQDNVGQIQLTPMAFSNIGLVDGFVIGTVTVTAGGPITLAFENNPSFNWSEVDAGGNPVNDPGLNGWQYADLEAAGEPDLIPGGSGPVPAPPIVEIVTIVLVAPGLAAIGGYVWYRRRHMVAAVPA